MVLSRLSLPDGARPLKRIVFVVLSSLWLAACASAPDPRVPGETTPAPGTDVAPAPDVRGNQFILVEPLIPNPQHQLEVAQISQLLQEHELNREQTAVLLYRRGALYDALGMTTLARIDFNQVLELRPGMSDAYNYIGIHATQAGDFEAAFEAFDSVLELDPEHPYVFLNRGIAAYYAGQYDLAQVDLADYQYQEPQDPYRVLWLFFADYALDPSQAYNLLEQRQQNLPDDWELNLVRLFSGQITAQQLMASTLENIQDQRTLTERLAEAYFYLGKYERMQNQPDEAANYFKLALATNVFEFIEHRYAYLELSSLRNSG